MKTAFSILFLTFSFLSCKTNSEITTDNDSPVPVALEPKIENEIVLSNRGIIWGFDFLPNGEILFTEKSGKLGLFFEGKITEFTGLPNDINSEGQGGLLDIALHPNYKINSWIYASYSSLSGGNGVLNLIRFKIENNTIKNVENIFKSSATNKWKGHYGSRIVFDKKGMLYLSVGEGGPSSYGGESSPNQNAQNVKESWGKVHRMLDDGKVPSDNPILQGNTNPSTIFSFGHRNPQGLVLNTDSGEIWESEHGPKGGDELNLIEKGANYGWPLVSHGVNYDGKIVSNSPLKAGIAAPTHQWTPSIATSGLAYISSEKYGSWKGSYLAGGLALKYLSRIEIAKDKTVNAFKLLENIGRIRNVKQAPDGFIYVSVESPGRIIKLVPKF